MAAGLAGGIADGLRLGMGLAALIKGKKKDEDKPKPQDVVSGGLSTSSTAVNSSAGTPASATDTPDMTQLA